MSFIAFIIAVFAGVRSFMEGFAVAAANAIQLEIIPESAKEIINSIAKNMGLSLDTVAAIKSPEIVNASWLLVGAAVIGVIAALLCFAVKKFSALLLFISAIMCGAAGFIADGKIGISFAYAVMFMLAAVIAFFTKSKQDVKKTETSKSVNAPVTSQKVNLKKGEKVNLTKTYPISKIVVGLGWSVNKTEGADFDLDASVFLLSGNEKVANDADFIFYGNKVHSSGAVEHMGDNLTGSTGSNDDEQIKINLKHIPANINKIIFAVTIYEAKERSQNFGQVSSAFIRIFDEENSRELVHYDLTEKFSTETAIICGELYKTGSEWNFNAIGSGFNGGLEALCRKYGVNV